MKKISSLILALSLASVVLVGCGGSKSKAYTATTAGFGGDVTVEVKVAEDGKIEEVNIDAANETPELGGAAAEELAKAIVESQGVDVDTISGATVTSEAVIKAAGEALEQAK